MSWKDNLRDASFRGVSFCVPSHELSGGRRLVTHEYPLRDEPYTEDLGLKVRRYSVEAYVVGDGYMDARDKLVEALNKEGEGELVHPYLGTLTVQCDSYTMSESSDEGRMARFSMQFVESGEDKYPDESQDAEAAVDDAADELDDAETYVFASDFDVDGLPEFAETDALGVLDKFFSSIGSAIGSVEKYLSVPLTLAGKVQSLISSVSDAYFSAGHAYSECAAKIATLGSFGNYKSLSSASQSSKAMIRNNNALVSLIRHAAAAETARCAAAADYETRQDAERACESIAEVLDAEAERTLDSDLYNAEVALRAAVVTAIPSEDLPELMSVEIVRPMTSLTLAYETYGDATRAGEIVQRNDTPHPGFISGTVSLVSEA